MTLLSFDLLRNYYCKSVAPFEENSILLLSEYSRVRIQLRLILIVFVALARVRGAFTPLAFSSVSAARRARRLRKILQGTRA